MFVRNGQPIDINYPQSFDGVNFPAGFFADQSTRDAYGITEVSDPIPPAPTRDELIASAKAQFEMEVQMMLDAKAQEHGYDNVISACSYTGAANPFQAESQAFVSWRGNVWSTCYSMMNNIVQNNLPIPTWEEVQASLPVYGA